MPMLRSRLLTMVLTIFVGLGLASQAFAHRLPTGAERALTVLQAAGVPLAALCGHGQDQSPCADEFCSICPGGIAALYASAQTLVPVPVVRQLVVALPAGETVVAQRLLQGHFSQGPPPVLH